MTSVTSTYRLQLHDGFGFDDAAAQVPHLAHLGVSHLYLSPILQAAPGSTHGYDVVDHGRISTALGGRTGFESLAATVRRHGLGIVADVVPNHMAIPTPESLNRPLWQVLRDGRDAPSADWFDIDWKSGGGRIGLPVLGRPLDEVIARGELRRDDTEDGPVLRYFDHMWPLSLGSEDIDDLDQLLQRQHYRLAWWRDKDDVLNYRRFFEVDDLIAVRVELPEVFEATHRLLLELHHAGLIDGFRIDHPDGLADPAGYLRALTQACAPDTPIWVEKILESGERLPADWECRGTTGYDALAAIQAGLLDSRSAPVLDECWRGCVGDESYEHVVDSAKREVVDDALAPEVDRLTRRAREARPDLDAERVREAVTEVLVSGDVYRAYVRPEERIGHAATERLRTAFTRALAHRPDLAAELEALIPLALIVDSDDAVTDFGVRLQQTWGPVMAKGVEDTTFYRWNRFLPLNEVGSDPTVLDTADAADLHQWCAWQEAHRPGTMTTLTTHDTKRSEDVRARLLAVMGDTGAWEQISRMCQEEARRAGVDLPTAHLIWQTVLGTMPIGADRLEGYLRKAMREAKTRTAWTRVDEGYEERVIAFAQHTRTDGPLHDLLAETLDRNAAAIRATTLSLKLVQLTMTGLPDVYQGCEGLVLTLVDPDNRRPVDYAHLEEILDLPQGRRETLEEEKIHLTSRALRARRDHPETFGTTSAYRRLDTDSEHAIAFLRAPRPRGIARVLDRAADADFAVVATRAAARLEHAGGWRDARVAVPPGRWHDHLGGLRHDSDGSLFCRDLFAHMPVALLEREP